MYSPTSYITAEDLLELNLTPINLTPGSSCLTPLSAPAPAPAHQTQPAAQLSPRPASRSRTRTRHSQSISFSPTVESYSCAPDGERDDVLVQAHMAHQSLARSPVPRLAVKTYSIDTPDFGAAFSKVAHSLSATLQASLSPNSYSGYPGGRVCQAGRLASDWERDDGADGWNARSARAEEAGLVGGEGVRKGGMKIRLPGLTRRRGSRSASCGAKGILKRGCSGDDKLDRSQEEEDDALPELSRSPSSPPLSDLSSSPTDILSLSLPARATSHAHPGVRTSLRPCCLRCNAATDYGLALTADYTERFSKGALRLREAEERRQAEEAARLASATARSSRKTLAPSTGSDAVDAVEEAGSFGKGRKVVVDELSLAKREQRVTHRASQAELKIRFCEAKEEVLGLVGMEERDAGGDASDSATRSPSSDEDTPSAVTSSSTPSPTLESADHVPALPQPPVTPAPRPATRPTPKVRSSADDILPQKAERPAAPPAPRRRFTLGSLVFGAGVGMGEAGRAGRGF